MMTTNVARWEARGGKRFVQLTRTVYDDGKVGYGYTDNGGGGSNFQFSDDDTAIIWCEKYAVAILKSDFPSVKRVS